MDIIKISIKPINPFFPSIGLRFNERATLITRIISKMDEKISDAAFLVSERSNGLISAPEASLSTIFPLYFPLWVT